jgi:UDP-glucuronate 4-epimerase
MKILVTGAAGFIGYHLSRKLIDNGHTVIGVDNINDYYDIRIKHGRLETCGIKVDDIEYGKLAKSNIYDSYSFIKLNIVEKDKLETLFSEEAFDAVVNLAAQAGVRYSITNPDAYLQSNIIGFYNILELSRHFKIKHLVYASSSSVYGWNEKMPFSTTDNVDHPISLYAASKKSNELLAHAYSALYDLPTTGLRFFTVYGPWGRPDMALFLFTDKIFKGDAIDVYNHGNMVRDFTYIDDIVNGIFKVISSPPKPDPDWDPKVPNPSSSKAPYKVYNIGNSNPVRLMDFIEAIEEKIGKKAKMNLLPLQPGDVLASHADVSDLVKNFDYKPDTDVKTGISNFIDWYKEFYKIS